MSFIPAIHTVGLRKYSPDGVDGLNNRVKSWGDPEDFPVCAIYTASTGRTASILEPQIAGHDRVVTDLCLITPAEFPASPHDRVVRATSGMPLVFPFAFGHVQEFEIIGYSEDYTSGPWWNPGVVTWNLRCIEGG